MKTQIILCTAFITLNILLSCTTKAKRLSAADLRKQVSPELPHRINSSIFISTFLESIQQSDILKKALGQAFSEPITKDLYYDDLFATIRGLGVPTPKNLAKDVSNAIRFVKKLLNPQIFSFVVASALDTFLTNGRVLTAKNAASIARMYADILERVLSSEKSASLKNSIDATIHFLKSFIELTPNRVYVLGIDFVFALYFLKEGVPKEDGKTEAPKNSISLEDNTSTFAVTFSQALSRSKLLKSVFSYPLKAHLTRNFYLRKIADTLRKVHVLRPRPLTLLLDGAIRPIVQTITPSSYAFAVVTSTENFLKDQHLLTSSNSEKLSERFVEVLEKTAYTLGQPREPHTYVDVLIEATLQYLANLNLLDSERVQILAFYYVRNLCKLKH